MFYFGLAMIFKVICYHYHKVLNPIFSSFQVIVGIVISKQSPRSVPSKSGKHLVS